jgi:hypothetical protein
MRIQTRASIEIPAAPERVFDLVVDHGNSPRFFRRWGPIPGVVRCAALAESGAGRLRRTLELTDGSTLEEEILMLARPHSYQYRWLNPPAAPLNLVVRTAETHWAFQALQSGQTRVVWTYDFELRFSFAYPFAVGLCAMFNRWMVEALERVRQTSLDAGRAAAR